MEEPSNPQKKPQIFEKHFNWHQRKTARYRPETDKPNSVASVPASLNSDAGPSALKGDTMGSHMPE